MWTLLISRSRARLSPWTLSSRRLLRSSQRPVRAICRRCSQFATSIQSAVALWADDSYAVVFVTAAPPTEATGSAVGVLFLLKRTNDSWRIADHQRFVATGKEAEVSAKLTAGTGSGYHLGSEGMEPVVTVKESQGGRGYAYQISASYTLKASKLKRLNLE